MSDKALTLSLARLPRALGSTLREDIVWVAPDDLGTPSMSVTPGTPIELLVDLTSVEDGVLVQVATSVDLVGECVRCLEEVREHHDVYSAEVYFESGAPALTVSEDDDVEADDLFVIGERDSINIETQLRDAIVTLVDLRPLCSPDCAGLCDVCGEKWAGLPADHEHVAIDPRLASLASLLGDNAEPGRS